MLNNLKALLTFNFFSFVLFVYFFSLEPFGDPRLNDHALGWGEMYLYEYPIAVFGLISCFAIILSSVFNAWGKSSKFISLAILFIWPLAFVYSWYQAYGLLQKKQAYNKAVKRDQ